MSSAFRVKTFPELYARMVAHDLAQRGVDGDGNIGAVRRTVYEAAALNDTDQYIQMGKLIFLRSIDGCVGDDLDRLALEIGAFFYVPLRRLQPRGSVVKVSFSDGALAVSAQFTTDVLPSATSFVVDDADDFPSSGSAYLERGTARQEKIIYLRSGNTFTVMQPATGVAFPHAAFGSVARIATQSTLLLSAIVGATSITVLAGTGAAWPTSGTVVFDRGSLSEERKTFTRAGDVFTLGAGLSFAHGSGAFVYLSTFGSDRSVSAGTQVFVPATNSSKQVPFKTGTTARLFDGDVVSDLVDASCLVVGQETNVGSSVVTKFASSPYANATVTNPIPAFGGRNQEKDEAFKIRLKNFVSTASAGTPLAIETKVLGLEDEASNSIVAFAQVINPVNPGMSQVYITDGSTDFVLDRQVFYGRDVAISDAVLGDRRGRLHQSAPYLKQAQPLAQRTPRVFASLNRGTSSSVGANFLEDVAQSMPVNAFTNMFLKTADDQFFLISSNTTIRFNIVAGGATPVVGAYAVLDLASVVFLASSTTGVGVDTLTDSSLALTVNQYAGYYVLDSAERLFQVASNTATIFTFVAKGLTPAVGAYKVYYSNRSLPLVPGVDFNFNETNGDLETAASLVAHDAVVAASDGSSPSVGAYSYTIGLGALVQRVINGDPSDFANFPGVLSNGTACMVTAPTIVSPTLFLSTIPKPGFAAVDVVAAVKSVVQTYVNSLGIGQKIVLAKIIELVMELDSVQDVTFVDPQGNVYVGNGQMARVDDTNLEVAA